MTIKRKTTKTTKRKTIPKRKPVKRRNPNPWNIPTVDVDESKLEVIQYLDKQIREYSREGGQGWALSFFEKLKKEVYAIRNEDDLNNFLTTIAVKEMTLAKITDIVQED